MSTPRTLAKFEGMKTRLLEPHERPFSTEERAFPLVVEPGGARSGEALKHLLATQSKAIKEAVYEYGAVLFRGFELADEHELEASIKSIQGIRPMTNYFMSEKGRDTAGGTSSVFLTNRYRKTGGTLAFLVYFHSENFYSSDVPALQVFWCKAEPWLGGETGFVHMANAYAELDAGLQAKLESEPIFTNEWPLTQVAAEYGLPEARVEAFFRERGMLQITPAGEKRVVLLKPLVYRHPYHGKRAFQVNLGENRLVTTFLNQLLVKQYTGPKWAVLRYTWKHAYLTKVMHTLEKLPSALKYPDVMGKQEWDEIEGLVKGLGARFRGKKKAKAPPPAPKVPAAGEMLGSSLSAPSIAGMARLGDKIAREDAATIAKAARKHTSVFTWKKGDVILFDNVQVHHAGMPGVGPRELRVMMCDPIPMKFPLRSGRIDVSFDESYRSIDEQLRAMKDEPQRQVAHGA